MLTVSALVLVAGGVAAALVARRPNAVLETLAGVLIIAGLVLLGHYLQKALPLFRPVRIG